MSVLTIIHKDLIFHLEINMKIKLADNIMVTNPLFIFKKDLNANQIKKFTFKNDLKWMEYTLREINLNSYLPSY